MTYVISTTDNRTTVVRTDNPEAYEATLAEHVAAFRVVTTDDLARVPRPTLTVIYNMAHPEAPVNKFESRVVAARRTFPVLDAVSRIWEPQPEGGDYTAPVAEATPAATEPKTPRTKPGVIASIRAQLEADVAKSNKDILATLVVEFPDRAEKGMKTTVSIQASKWRRQNPQ